MFIFQYKVVKLKMVKQAKKTIIRKIDESSQSKDKTFLRSTLLPNSFHILIVGPSNCDRTNVMINLIEEELFEDLLLECRRHSPT